MKRILPLIVLLAACSSTPVVQQVRIAIPQPAANVARANQSISFGGWSTTVVSAGTTPFFLESSGIVEKSDQPYRMVLQGPALPTSIECHTRAIVAGPAGVFVQESLGESPILVCGLSRSGLRSVLALTRSGSPDPIRGELRQIDGVAYDVRSLHRAVGSTEPSSEVLGFEISLDQTPLAVIETVEPGRVWIDPDAPNRDDLAAAAAALLLFR